MVKTRSADATRGVQLKTIESPDPRNDQPKSEVKQAKKLFPCKRKMPCCAEDPCDRILATKWSLMKHLRLVHGWSPSDLENIKKKKVCKSEKSCPNCGVKVANSSNLSRHLKRYCPKIFTEMVHKCSVCEEGFNFSADLRIHMISNHKTHSLFWCAYCAKNCTSADKLRLHVLVHLQSNK